jgi:hypothetical protein
VADHDVIAAVSLTLQGLVTAGLQTLTPAPPAEVVDLPQPAQSNAARVTLFLYEIIEDPSARNRPHGVSASGTPAGSSMEVRKPPLSLLLRYLVTPWSGDWETDQKIIGRVLQIFYDGAIISGPSLQGVLANTSEALKVTLAPISLEDRARVWYSIQQPYRLSLTYEVRVVNLDSTEARQTRPVREKTREGAEVEA